MSTTILLAFTRRRVANLDGVVNDDGVTKTAPGVNAQEFGVVLVVPAPRKSNGRLGLAFSTGRLRGRIIGAGCFGINSAQKLSGVAASDRALYCASSSEFPRKIIKSRKTRNDSSDGAGGDRSKPNRCNTLCGSALLAGGELLRF